MLCSGESEDSWPSSPSPKNNKTLEERETVKQLMFKTFWTHFLLYNSSQNSVNLYRFLMKTLDAHGDDYRNAQLTILLEVRIRPVGWELGRGSDMESFIACY